MASDEILFENVDRRRGQTCLYCKLTYGPALGSGELITQKRPLVFYKLYISVGLSKSK